MTNQGDAERELAGAEEIDRTEIERMKSVGFTKAEAECWVLAYKLANKFFELPDLHPTDDHEVTHAIHVVQNKLLARPTYRRYRELAREGSSETPRPTGGTP